MNDEDIALCVAGTTLATKGISGLSATRTDMLTKNFHIKEPSYRGIKISSDEEMYTIDIFVSVDYDASIPEVAWDLQKNIKKVLKKRFNINTEAINVHVQEVKLPSGTGRRK